MSQKIYISLTSINGRQKKLVKTLQSILIQTVKPEKCFIYLSEEPYLLDTGFPGKDIGEELQSFVDRHNLFEIRWTKNIGPYRKLLPLLKEKWNEDCLILTIDDDIKYHKEIIENYLEHYRVYQCCVSYRGFTPKLACLEEFDYYTRVKESPIPYLYNFANSGVGMVTHPKFFHKTGDLIFREDLFQHIKTADDIWYYICRIANNVKTVIFNLENVMFATDNGAEKNCLYGKFNGVNNKNTVMFRNILSVFKEMGYIE